MVYPLWLSSGDGRELVPRLGIEHCEECCGNPVAMGLVDHPGFGKDGVGVGGASEKTADSWRSTGKGSIYINRYILIRMKQI